MSAQQRPAGPSRRKVLIGALATAAAAAAPLRAQPSATTPAAGLKVMTFNIRYGTANDGENHWDKRKAFLVETVTGIGTFAV